MADSPVGAAAWIFEKFGKWADLPTTADGSPDIWSKFSEERVAHGHHAVCRAILGCNRDLDLSRQAPGGITKFPANTRIQVPTGVAAFPDPVFLPPPRSFAEKTYNIVHWSEMPSGGHFAPWSSPSLMLADLRAFISTVARKHQ